MNIANQEIKHCSYLQVFHHISKRGIKCHMLKICWQLDSIYISKYALKTEPQTLYAACPLFRFWFLAFYETLACLGTKYDIWFVSYHFTVEHCILGKKLQRVYSKDSQYHEGITCTFREILHIVFTKCSRLETENIETHMKTNLNQIIKYKIQIRMYSNFWVNKKT